MAPPHTLTISSSPERCLFPTYWPDGWLLRNSGSTQSLFSVLMSIHVSQGLIFLWTLNDGPRGNMEFHSSRNGKSKCFFPERLNSITNPWLRDYSLIYWNVRVQLAATAGAKWLPGDMRVKRIKRNDSNRTLCWDRGCWTESLMCCSMLDKQGHKHRPCPLPQLLRPSHEECPPCVDHSSQKMT